MHCYIINIGVYRFNYTVLVLQLIKFYSFIHLINTILLRWVFIMAVTKET